MHERNSVRGRLRWNKVHRVQSMSKLTPVFRAFTISALSFLAAMALLFALPVGATAQSAGDDQYADPFGEVPDEGTPEPAPEPDPGTGSGDGSEGGSPNGGDGTSSVPTPDAPDTTTSDTPAVDPTDGSDFSAPSSRGEELARTGLPSALLALMGVGLLLTGSLLRLAVRPARR